MKAENAGRALALVVVDELVRAGLTDACLAPGSRSAPLALALAGDARVRLHVVIDERSAAFLALGIAKASGRPAAVLSTSGTAPANFHPAVIEAFHSRTPLLVLTADRPPELRDTGANQTVDQIRLYGGSVRWFADLGAPEARPEAVRYWRSVASRAWAAATGAPAGPVHLNVPLRDPLVPLPDEQGFPHDLDGRPGGEPWVRATSAPRPPSPQDAARLAAEIAAAPRGLVVACGEAVNPVPVHALARAAGWPVLADPLSGARTGDLAVSAYDALLRHQPFAAAHRPELVLRLGGQGTSPALSGLLGAGVRQVLADPDAAWPDPGRAAAWAIDADPSMLCAAVADALSLRGPSPWLDSWLGAERAARRAIDRTLDAIPEPSEPRAARDLAGALPDGATLVVASSMPVRDLEWFMARREGLRVLGNRGASGIDGFVSTALGAALAGPGPTAALAGDLSILHDANGLLLARRERVDAVFVVLDNDGGGIFSFLPQAGFPDHFETLFGTPHGVDLGGLAALHGCGHVRVERAGDLAPAVAAAMAEGGVHLVVLRTERTANAALHRSLWDAVGAALGPR